MKVCLRQVAEPQMSFVEERDDRTIRTLATLVGTERAELAFTHFTQARVLLSASLEALSTQNGRLAYAVSANMLTRFVGALDCWLPAGAGDVDEFGDSLLADLRDIDTRPQKTIRIIQGNRTQGTDF